MNERTPGKRIAITGATGLIGATLAADLAADGAEVMGITRRPTTASDVGWDVEAGSIDAARLEGLDAVVHLAGEPIGAARWTRATRDRIMRSRRDGTNLIATTLAKLDEPPGVLVSGSAVGYYGDHGAEVIDESTPAGDDFLAQVCAAWESAAGPARHAGIRVVHPRTGVVIAREGALIDKVELPFRLGVGGRVGSGHQFVPWISLADQVAALRFLIDRELEGPVNLVAPQQIDNRELTRALGKVLRRPTLVPIPVMAIRALYGQMGVTLATTSQRVVPGVLGDAGFSFSHTDIHAALSEALGR
ncbi:MAG: TIGR01777 family oxidoreductase [Nitriliruptoraceae bacterium]